MGLPSGTKVTSAWDATVTNSGDHWTAKNVGWNGTLAPGASVSFGFNGSGPGSPSNCKLNGGSCGGTSVPRRRGTLGARDTHLRHHRHLGETVLVAATDDKGIKNYDVLRDGAKVATVTGTTYTNTGLTAGTDYSYTVQARDTADQTGPVSGAVKVTTTGGGGGP